MPSPTAAAGRVLGAVFGAAATLRGARPIHTRGIVLRGTLTVTGARPPLGVALLDVAGSHPVIARLSRAAGLPPPLPDILGIALRIPGPDRPVDLLMSTTGTARGTRHLLVPRRAVTAAHTTLAPFRSPAGPLRLAVVPAGRRRVPAHARAVLAACAERPLAFRLRAAVAGGPWRDVGTLVLDRPGDGGDARLRFDPVLHAHPDLPSAPGWARLRTASYAAARRRAGDGGRRRPRAAPPPPPG